MYIPALDGMRAIAILLVLGSHYGGDRLLPGGFGVTLFFFISGFIITRTLATEYEKAGHISIGGFYLRRFLRLAPALCAMLFGVSVVYYLLVGPFAGTQLVAGLFYVMNYYVILGGALTLPIGLLWSLAVEEHYYLVYPAVFSALWKLPERFLTGIAVLCLVILLWRMVLVFWLGAGHYHTYYSTDTRIDSILYGAALAIAVGSKSLPSNFASIPIVSLAIASLLVTFLYRNEAFRETARYTIQGIAIGPLFYAALFSDQFLHFRKLLESSVLVWVGKISYSLYLWHFAALYFAQKYFGLNSKAYLFALIASFLLASFSYYAIERPVQRARHQFVPVG